MTYVEFFYLGFGMHIRRAFKSIIELIFGQLYWSPEKKRWVGQKRWSKGFPEERLRDSEMNEDE